MLTAVLASVIFVLLAMLVLSHLGAKQSAQVAARAIKIREKLEREARQFEDELSRLAGAVNDLNLELCSESRRADECQRRLRDYITDSANGILGRSLIKLIDAPHDRLMVYVSRPSLSMIRPAKPSLPSVRDIVLVDFRCSMHVTEDTPAEFAAASIASFAREFVLNQWKDQLVVSKTGALCFKQRTPESVSNLTAECKET